MLGCEMVCPLPIGSGASSYALCHSPVGTNRWRGVSSNARSTARSPMPFPRIVSTSRWRAPRNLSGCAPNNRASRLRAPGSQLLPPLLRRAQDVVVREIEMQWRDRDVPLVDRAKVGVLFPGPGDLPATDPEDLATPGILHRLERVRVGAPAESREPHAPDLVRRQWWQVHVQQGVGRETLE